MIVTKLQRHGCAGERMLIFNERSGLAKAPQDEVAATARIRLVGLDLARVTAGLLVSIALAFGLPHVQQWVTQR